MLANSTCSTDASERPMLDGQSLEADLIVTVTGACMAEMFPKLI